MAFDCKERKPLLYADLFKQNQKTTISETSTCSSWTESLPCDSSSSSGFSTPFGSEFELSESDDGDFTAELTRQMAECMLQEDEKEEEKDRANSTAESTRQVYQLENQPRVKKQVHASRGRRVKSTESAKQSQLEKTEKRYVGYRGRDWRAGKVQNGSDMRVVFLGGPGSRPGLINGSSGTGVFLPRARATNEPVPVQPKKKSGCPTVLVPTRVLEVLEQHFNRFSDSSGPPLRGGSTMHSCPKDDGHISKGQRNRHSQAANKDDEMQLPQEWTY